MFPAEEYMNGGCRFSRAIMGEKCIIQVSHVIPYHGNLNPCCKKAALLCLLNLSVGAETICKFNLNST